MALSPIDLMQDDEDEAEFGALMSLLSERDAAPDVAERVEPVAPEAFEAPTDDTAFADVIGGLTAPAQQPDATQRQAAPEWARGLDAATTPTQLASAGTNPLRQAGAAMTGTARDGAQMADLRAQESALQAPEARSDRWRRGRQMMAAEMLGLSPDQARSLAGPSPEERLDDVRARIAQGLERRAQTRQERNRMMLAGLQRRQEQANADRRFALDAERNRQIDAYRQAQLAQRGEQFTAREIQDMKQDELRGRRAQRRTDTMAGALGRGPTRNPDGSAIVAPGAAESAELTPEAMTAQIDRWRNQDSFLTREIDAYLRRRGVDTSTPDGQRELYREIFQNRGVLGRTTSRAYNQVIDNYRSGEGAGRSGETVDARLAEVERRQRNEEAERAIPGWRVTNPDQFRLQANEAREVRELNANMRSARASIGRILQVQSRMTPTDYASLRTNSPTQNAAELLRLSRSIQTAIRKMDAMGVPTGNELAEARQQAPEAGSWQMFVAGQPSFRGLMHAMAVGFNGYMTGMGLEPDRGGAQ